MPRLVFSARVRLFVGVNRCKMTRGDVLTRLDLPQRKASVDEQTGLCTGFAESELLQIGRDPFLIAYAMVSPQEMLCRF
jgi:hypothetical protein